MKKVLRMTILIFVLTLISVFMIDVYADEGLEILPKNECATVSENSDFETAEAALSKSVVVEVNGQNVTLNAERYTDGDIYVAYYKGEGILSSLKIYPASNGYIKADVDSNAVYSKVMWLNSALMPNCAAKEIRLKDQYSITYYIDNNDGYLQSIDIENPNPSEYFTQDGLLLKDLLVDGYNFMGWYTAQSGGSRVTEIPVGEKGDKTLYAHWEKVSYTIHFACDMQPVADQSYTVGEEVPLPKPNVDKYTFVGWSDKDGNVWDSIPAGTTGNISLYANWSSNRNQAVAEKKLDDPIIFEDSKDGLMLFTYEIGEIRNVPLFTTLNLRCANGIITTVSRTETNEISESNAETVAKAISNATTKSSSWTLSNEWNKTTEVSQSYLDQTGQTREEAESWAKSESNTYNLGASYGGTRTKTASTNESFKLSKNRAHSDTTTTEKGQNFNLSVDAKYSNEVSAGLQMPISGVGDLNVGAKSGYEIGAGIDYGNYKKTTKTGTDSWSKNSEYNIGSSTAITDSKTWNTSEGFESSSTSSRSGSITNIISQVISKEYGYGESYTEGGSSSENFGQAVSQSQSDEFSSTVTYSKSKIDSQTESFQSTGDTIGGYRMVMAGTMHVFAVVGYDVANKSYFVYTYNVMDDDTYEYLDYSRDETFNDYETSIIPFEIPYFVNEYVNNRVARSEGLLFNPDTGIIEGYNPSGDKNNDIVVIPSYISVDRNDGTFEAVKVTGIAPGLFKDNKDIVGVQLGNYITEIPDSAFEGCSSLKYVLAPGVTKIGSDAFSGCSSLSPFTLPIDTTELGDNAFAGAPEIKATPSSAAIALAAASCGADNITLDISEIPEADAENIEFNIGKISKFELQGKDKDYKGLSVRSDAATTVLNGIAFVQNKQIPISLSSSNVTLDRVSVDCTGYAILLKADNTNIKLNRTVSLNSATKNTILCKNISLENLSSGVVGKLNVTGNMLVCGAINGERYLSVNDGEIIYITEDEYNRLNTDNLSEWMPKSSIPENAEIVNTKYKYNLTTKKQSNSPTMDGYTLYDTTFVWSDWGGWTPNGISGSDTREVQTRTMYRLFRYTCADCKDHHPLPGTCSAGSYSMPGYTHPHTCGSSTSTWNTVPESSYEETWIETPPSDLGYYVSYPQFHIHCLGPEINWWYAWWWDQYNYTRAEYRSRDKIFTYYFQKVESLESDTYPTGDGVSNVEEWVQYLMN